MTRSVCVILGVLAGVSAFAQATRPATTQARPRGNDPIQLLVDHAVAMALGQEQVVRDCYIIRTPQEEEMVQGYMSMARALDRLRLAAERRFGPAGFENIGFKRLLDEDQEKIVNARVEFSEDKKRATVTPERSSSIQLMLVGDQWRILTGESHRNIPNRLVRLRAQVGAYGELADEIEAGKYALPIEAQIAGFRKVKEARAAAEERIRMTTRPSTGPT